MDHGQIAVASENVENGQALIVPLNKILPNLKSIESIESIEIKRNKKQKLDKK